MLDNNANALIAKIISEADAYAKRELADAQKKAETILAQAQEDAKKEGARRMDAAKGEMTLSVERQISAAKLDAKKEILKTKQTLIQKAIARAVEKVSVMDDQSYFAIMEKMLENAISDSGQKSGEIQVIVSKGSRISDAFLKDTEKKLGGVTLKKAGETRDIGDGFILKTGDIELNGTLLAVIRSMQDDLEQAIAGILF